MNDKEIDLGSGHSVRFMYDGDKICALREFHINHNDGVSECGGLVPLGEGEWEIKKLEPLTVVPSIDCSYCDSHGVILHGEWLDSRTPTEIAKDKRQL